MHPKWVHRPTITSQASFWTRSPSFWGSRSSSASPFFAEATSSPVLRRIKTGLPCHTIVIDWPSAIGSRLTSTVDSASTSAEGFIESINGQAKDAAPTTPMPPAASTRKSRRPASSSSVSGDVAVSAIMYSPFSRAGPLQKSGSHGIIPQPILDAKTIRNASPSAPARTTRQFVARKPRKSTVGAGPKT